jgi:hypothetical protein
MVAKAALAPAGWSPMMPAAQVMGCAITPGFPAAVPASMWEKPLVNMNDWY